MHFYFDLICGLPYYNHFPFSYPVGVLSIFLSLLVQIISISDRSLCYVLKGFDSRLKRQFTSKIESMMVDDGDPTTGLLLRDIKEIGKALYLHSSAPKALNASHDRRLSTASSPGISGSKSEIVLRDSSRKDKKSSIWSWRPLRALTHICHQRFNCCFFLHVHSIEGMPSTFNNLKLCVTWKRKSDMLRTSPAPVSAGTSEIEETLMHRCTLYASKTGPHGAAKYEPKLFSLQTSVIEAPMLNIGQHWIDLTRLLPLWRT